MSHFITTRVHAYLDEISLRSPQLQKLTHVPSLPKEMSSEQRSNSAVRNLRSIFENKSSDSVKDARGRSPGSGTLSPDAQDQPRPISRVRASFIPVEPSMAALAAEQRQDNSVPEQQNNPATEQKRGSSVGLRRASMSEGHSGDALDLIKDTVGMEADRRGRQGSVAEIIPEQAVETPALEDNKKDIGVSTAAKVDKEPENPDKPVTGEQEEPADMKPADPVSETAVSGGEALPPVAEDLRKNTKPATSKPAATKPGAISTKGKAPSSTVKSPASQAKSPLSTTSAKVPTKKPSRSSLTAPTAASVARASAADAKTTSSATAKPKPREITKPMDISSRLTAPTAASRARLEGASNTAKAPAPSRPQQKIASARPTPRPSLGGRPESRSSQNATKKPTGPVDSSFLERMSRPTAASAARTAQEKTEVKSPPRQKALPTRPKANGHPKPVKTTAKAAAAEPGDESIMADESVLPQEEEIQPEVVQIGAAAAKVEEIENEPPAAPAAVPEAAQKDVPEGNETPAHANGFQEDAPALEDTPAAIGGEDTIR